MIGMDRRTGLPVTGIDHLRQSIEDILSTPLGSRRMRPNYGSNLRRFVDLPVNEGWKSAVQAEAARALKRWEPRVDLNASGSSPCPTAESDLKSVSTTWEKPESWRCQREYG
jgi:phage baseplate assembly protein W